LHTLEIGGESFRVLVKTTAAGERIAVAQEAGFRNEIARDGALRTVMPFLILVPVLLLIVADLVRKMFRPIAALSKEIDQRPSRNCTRRRPPPSGRGAAIRRGDQSAARPCRPVDGVSAPLCGGCRARAALAADRLSLQAERLAETEMSGLARERLTVLRQGIERGRSLLDQLLTLAKAQSATDPPKSPISVQSIYRRVLEDLMPLAEAKHIDIGVEGTQDAEVWASELDMIALVKNLVDNAIRYTPEGGRVDLSVGISEGKPSCVFRIAGLAFRWQNGIGFLIPSTARWAASRLVRA
jgi:two-component system OmpR family sensor kinase